MLPTTTVNGGKRGAAQRSGLPLYLRRIIRPKQMDFECGLCPAHCSARVSEGWTLQNRVSGDKRCIALDFESVFARHEAAHIHLRRCGTGLSFWSCLQVHLLANAAALHFAKDCVRPQACPGRSCNLHMRSVLLLGLFSTTWFVNCRYRHTSYHKQTKNQWARDDPAFVVICCLLLTIAAAAYCATCGPNALALPVVSLTSDRLTCCARCCCRCCQGKNESDKS